MKSGRRTSRRGGVLALVMAALTSLVVGSTAELASGTTPAPPTAYVVSDKDGTLTPIDVATGTSATPINVTSSFFIQGTGGLAMSPDATIVYTVFEFRHVLISVDLATGSPGVPIELPNNRPWEIAVTPDGSTALVTEKFGEVQSVDLATGIATTVSPQDGVNIFNPPYMWGIAIAPDGATAYAVNHSLGTVTPIDVATSTAGAPVPVGSNARAIAIAPDGLTAYVTVGAAVVPIDLSTNTAQAPISVALNELVDVEISSDGSTLYALGQDVFGVEGVAAIDVATSTAGSPVLLPGTNGPGQIALSSDDAVAYVTSSASNSATPLDLSTNTPGAAIPVGTGPWGIAITPGSVQPPDADGDGDGVVDALDVAGENGAFSDAEPPALGQGTFGQIIETNGLDVLVTDASPGGVTITTSGAGGPAQFTLCAGALSVSMGANSAATFTCGSLTVSEVSGAPVIVSLGSRFVRFAPGTSGTVDATASGGMIFANVVGGDVSLSMGNLTGPVPMGDSALIESDSRNSSVTGTAGNDLIFDSGGNNSITGGGGHDTIVTGSGNDSIEGGDGDDWIDAGDGKNKVSGGTGNDTVMTGSGADSIDGGPGADTCNAGGGRNSVTNCP